MKKYQKVELIAKNLPTGSYAAGCPEYHCVSEPLWHKKYCRDCERAM